MVFVANLVKKVGIQIKTGDKRTKTPTIKIGDMKVLNLYKIFIQIVKNKYSACLHSFLSIYALYKTYLQLIYTSY